MELFLPFYLHVSLMGMTFLLAIIIVLRIYLRQVILCKLDEKLDGKVIIITGANSGIGQSVAMDLAKRGAHVVLACRDRTRRDSAPFAVRSRTGNVNVRFMYLDLSSLDSIVEFAREFSERESHLDILINNAGILCRKEWTLDGLDMLMGVNAFGHFLLTNLLMDKMRGSSGGGRIIHMVSSVYKTGQLDMGSLDLSLSEQDYTMQKAYSASNLVQMLLTREMAKRYKKDGIACYAVDPGCVNTPLYRHYPGAEGKVVRAMAKILFRSPEEGAQCVLYCCLAKDPEIWPNTGKYFYNCQVCKTDLRQFDDDFHQQLWDKMESVLKSKGFSLNINEYSDE